MEGTGGIHQIPIKYWLGASGPEGDEYLEPVTRIKVLEPNPPGQDGFLDEALGHGAVLEFDAEPLPPRRVVFVMVPRFTQRRLALT